MELFQSFFADKENINEIVLEIVVWVILGILGFILWLIRRTLRKVSIHLLTKVKKQFKKMTNHLKYKRTIKLIVKKKIPITDAFLLGKSPEKNPECAKIFQMLDSGELECPPLYKRQMEIKKFLEEHPELKDIKIDLDKLPDIIPKVNIQPPKLPRR